MQETKHPAVMLGAICVNFIYDVVKKIINKCWNAGNQVSSTAFLLLVNCATVPYRWSPISLLPSYDVY